MMVPAYQVRVKRAELKKSALEIYKILTMPVHTVSTELIKKTFFELTVAVVRPNYRQGVCHGGLLHIELGRYICRCPDLVFQSDWQKKALERR